MVRKNYLHFIDDLAVINAVPSLQGNAHRYILLAVCIHVVRIIYIET